MNKYKRIEMEEREEIKKKLIEGKSFRETGRELNRQANTITREIIGIKKEGKGKKN